MSDPAGDPVYSVDSSTLMDWQARYYPSDVFKTLLQKVDRLIAAKRFLAPVLVRDEVKTVGSADLIAWAEAHSQIFVPTAELPADAQAIQNQFAGFRDPKAEYEEADAYVIALARIRNGVSWCLRKPQPPRSTGQGARISFPMSAANSACTMSAF